MGWDRLQISNGKNNGFLTNCTLGLQWSIPDESCIHSVPSTEGLFASIGQMGSVGFGGGVSPNPTDSKDNEGGFKLPYMDLYVKCVSSPEGFKICGIPEKEKKKNKFKLKIKVADPSLRRLISGAIAGAVSRTAVAPLETIRTHLMVGSSGHSTTEVFQDIMKTDGWTGLFRGNLVNVIRVAPSKAVEVQTTKSFFPLISSDVFLI